MCGWSLGAPTLTKELAAKFPKRQNRETNRQNREYFFKSRKPYLAKRAKSPVPLAQPSRPMKTYLTAGARRFSFAIPSRKTPRPQYIVTPFCRNSAAPCHYSKRSAVGREEPRGCPHLMRGSVSKL